MVTFSDLSCYWSYLSCLICPYFFYGGCDLLDDVTVFDSDYDCCTLLYQCESAIYGGWY